MDFRSRDTGARTAIILGTGEMASIALIVALTLFYTFEGGMTAVIWTDVVQMFLYIAGAVVSLGFFIGSGERGAPQIAFHAIRILGVAMLVFWGMRAVKPSQLERIFGRFPGLLARVEKARNALLRD